LKERLPDFIMSRTFLEEIDNLMYNYGHLQVVFEDGSIGWYEVNVKIEEVEIIDDKSFQINFKTLIKIGLTSRFFQTLGLIFGSLAKKISNICSLKKEQN
jgi:hypothetical protein